LDEKDARTLFIQIIQGLSHLTNDLNQCHGDVKPSNILFVGSKQSIKLCDFGLSIDNVLDPQTNHKKIFGTSSFYPPELIAQFDTLHFFDGRQ
jgi:serine/threonine protein kinase